MMKRNHLSLMLCGSLLAAGALAQGVDESSLGEAVERHLSPDDAIRQWTQDPQTLNTDSGDELQTVPVMTEQVETVKLKDVIRPIRFESGVADIPQSYVDSLRKVLEEMRDRRNVRLHLVGHADDQRLSDALARVYGDNAGLSRERAGEVAEFLQTRLGLAPEAISYEWAGDSRPVATNATP
jgi:outer membrane protein OmpA-like peptidoglycan-associated protein